jgi:iron(III) transport system substrate-binding protein
MNSLPPLTLSRRALLLAAAAAAVAKPNFAHANQADWLKKAGLGSNAPAQDWKAIEAAARAEGKVIIYSVSSRITRLAKEFKEKFGVEIEAFDLPSNEQVEKFGREHKAGKFNVDVLYNNESPTMLSEFVPKKMVWNFVPDSVAAQLAANEKAPFLVQRWSSRVLIYNTKLHPTGSPVKNLWDLTLPEWKGRLHMPDPVDGGVQTAVMQTLLQQGAVFEKVYSEKFGTAIKYSAKVERAAKGARSVASPTQRLNGCIC